MSSVARGLAWRSGHQVTRARLFQGTLWGCEREQRSGSQMSDIRDVYRNADEELPLRRNKVSFAAVMPDGTTSNSWRVWTNGGDAYICCRDSMKEIKISLHQSGKQHVAFSQEADIEMTEGNRFWNQWHEPLQDGRAIPSFQLILPPWGMRLTESDRQEKTATRRKWDGNQILIDGDYEHTITVSLIILNDSTRLNLVGDCPIRTLAELPLRPGRRLHVVARKEPDRGLRAKIESALSAISRDEVEQALLGSGEDEQFSMCMTGDDSDGFAFMVVFPVELNDHAD